MHQDERGRWISDNGRYLWNGSDWVDLEPKASEPDTAPAGAPGPAPGPPPPEGPHRSRRRLLVLVGLLALVGIGVGAVVLIGDRSSSRPSSTVPSPALTAAAPGGLPPSAGAPAVLDEAQRRERVQGALLHRSDLPGTTEERAASPTDVFLPCRAPALTPPEGSVLAGQAVSNSDFTVYVGQTVVGFPTARQAAEALTGIRSAISRCAPYDYRYANSDRADHITHLDVGQPLQLGDGGVYLAEVDTPANYTGPATTYSYGYVQRGQFLVRLTLTHDSQADRPGLELLMSKTLAELG